MSGAALALVLGAAVIHATWNALAKRGRDPMAILWWAGAIGSPIITPLPVYNLSCRGFFPRALTHIHPLPYLWAMEAGSCVSLLAPVLARRGSLSREWRENRGSVLAAAVLSPGAYLLVLFAFQLSKAGYVVAGREVSIVISALMGSLWMKEGALGQRLLGAGVVASGVVCVALAR